MRQTATRQVDCFPLTLDRETIILMVQERSFEMVKIVHNKLLGGWYIVRGRHHTPISGRFDTKAEAQAALKRVRAADRAAEEALEDFNYVGSRHHY